MCGITGIIYKHPERRVDRDVLLAMRDTMVHRGPDDEGVYISGQLGLAHRRLSIVGLSTGHQPMSNSNEKLWIVFNGEIYNYPQLKRDMQQKDYAFRTESDTEVIIHLYAEYGKDCVHHLNGMFAFAIWDSEKQQLFMARDRLGVKPFYYAEHDGAVLFSSWLIQASMHAAMQPPCMNTLCFVPLPVNRHCLITCARCYPVII